jgi:ParB family transcriptional regulator, chromosome partitioning protein
MALGKSLDNILGDYFGEEVVDLNDNSTSQKQVLKSTKPSKQATPKATDAMIHSKIESVISEGKTVVRDIFIEDIDISPFQTRKQFDPIKLRSLADSIQKSGLIHPILVLERENPSDDEKPFYLIAGERRLRACQELGYELVLAVVKSENDLSDPELALLGAMENLQREDLNPMELSHTFSMLMETQELDEEGLAQILDHSMQYVKNYLRLRTLEEPVQRALINGMIGEGQARHLVGLETQKQLQLLDLIIQKDLTVREIQQILRRDASSLADENKYIPVIHNLSSSSYKRAEKLASYFPNSNLKVSGDESKGKIVIKWGN